MNIPQVHILSSNPKAKILLGQEKGALFISSSEELRSLQPELLDASSTILLIDADSAAALGLETEVIDRIYGNCPRVLFSTTDLSDDIIQEFKAERSFRLPFTIEDVLSFFDLQPEDGFCEEQQRILFVDDSSMIHRVVESILSPDCYILEHAYNGSEGLDAARIFRPDLIITDIEMPVMDGYEFCRLIKEDSRLRDTPVIIQSSLEDGLHIDRGFDAGADDYISKPVNGPDLISRIESLLKEPDETRETVLVADNSSLVRNMVISGLKNQGFNCIEGSSGTEILEIAEKGGIDLYIISHVLPGLSGLEAVRKLRKKPETGKSPVILLSSRDSQMDIRKYRSAGISEFLLKPFSMDRLLAQTEKLLAEYRFKKEKEVMSRYLSAEAVSHAEETALSDPSGETAVRKEARTILFIDIVGFTTLCEESEPEKVINLLNEYFDLCVSRIMENNGTIDKFIGDAVMAVFGGHEAAVVAAVKSSVEIIDTLKEMKMLKNSSLQNIDLRIGINTGKVVIGDLGSRHFRRDYTIIGDEVNVAQRLESRAPENSILVSSSVASFAPGNFEVESFGTISLKGKKEKTETWLIKGLIHQESH